MKKSDADMMAWKVFAARLPAGQRRIRFAGAPPGQVVPMDARVVQLGAGGGGDAQTGHSAAHDLTGQIDEPIPIMTWL